MIMEGFVMITLAAFAGGLFLIGMAKLFYVLARLIVTGA